METRRVRSVVVFVAFLCVLVAGNSEGNRKFIATFFSNEVLLNIYEIDEDTAEHVWMYCRDELEESTKALEDFDFYLRRAASTDYNEIKSDVALSTRSIIHKIINHMPPEVKEDLLDCLRKKNLPFGDSRADAKSESWCIKLAKWLNGWSSVPRRYLKGKGNIDIGKSPAEAPVVRGKHQPRRQSKSRAAAAAAAKRKKHQNVAAAVPAPGPALILAHSRHHAAASPAPVPPPTSVPASSPSSISLPPVLAPSVPPPIMVAPEPIPRPPVVTPSVPPPLMVAPEPAFPRQHNFPTLSGVNVSPMGPPKLLGAPFVQSQENTDGQSYIMAIIISASLGSCAIFALFLFCCLKGKRNRVGPKDGQRDEKPFLDVCSSDVSAGSSHGSTQQAQNLGNMSDKNFKSSSLVHTSIHGVSSLGASGNNNYAALPLPPGRVAPPPPQPPPPPPPKPPAPAPPPPPKPHPPPNPPKPGNLKKPLRPKQKPGDTDDQTGNYDAPKTKLKPFFWDKVLANPDHSMVWHEIKAGSFQFNEEMMETLFGYGQSDKSMDREKNFDGVPQYIQIIEPKKSQNLAILLKALNVTTEEVCDALKEGNELPVELIHTLLKMTLTTEEELKLRLYNGDLSLLGPAERFLKVMVDIPFAFKRLECLLFMSSFQEEVSSTKESFAILEVACKELRNNRLFFKLLEAVLKTGNRMNDGTFRGGAQAFKLDTLLKLSDVKGTDGKTTLLHFVVQEIIRSEGLRAARTLRESQSMSSVNTDDLAEEGNHETPEYFCNLGLQMVSGLANDLDSVKNAAVIDGDNLSTTVSKLHRCLAHSGEFLENDMKGVEEDTEFYDTVSNFLHHAEDDVKWLVEEQERIMALVKSTGDYFHGNAGRDEGLRLFVTVRDFLIVLDKVCKEVKNSPALSVKSSKKEA